MRHDNICEIANYVIEKYNKKQLECGYAALEQEEEDLLWTIIVQALEKE